MKQTTKSLSTLFSVAVFSASAFASNQQPAPSMTQQERTMTTYMAQRGVQEFLMLNKKRGSLMIIRNGEISKAVPALSGRKSGDDPEKMTTPAGIFPLTLTSDQSHPYAAIKVFYRAKEDRHVVIHRVLDIKGEQRRERLASASAEFKKISHGCINLSEKDYIPISNFANDARYVLTHTDGSKSELKSFLVVLPEKQSVEAFFNMPKP